MNGGAAPELLGVEADARKPRRRANGWEIALWVIGVVLLGGSGVLVYYFVKLILGNQQGQTPPDIAFLSAFLQASSIYTPGLVTGGIVCIALAMFARALDVNANRRESVHVAAPVVPSSVVSPLPEPVAPVSTPPVAPPTSGDTAEPGDYSAFMRPGS